MPESREDSVYLAKLTEQAEHYEETVENMKHITSSEELTVEEHNLLSVAYKNVIDACRASWRIISSVKQKEESKGNRAQVSMIKGYREMRVSWPKSAKITWKPLTIILHIQYKVLLSVVYKNVIGARGTSWRIISLIK